jgi:hypothetical protein
MSADAEKDLENIRIPLHQLKCRVCGSTEFEELVNLSYVLKEDLINAGLPNQPPVPDDGKAFVITKTPADVVQCVRCHTRFTTGDIEQSVTLHLTVKDVIENPITPPMPNVNDVNMADQ